MRFPPGKPRRRPAAPVAPQTYRNGPDVSANANFTYYVCADQTTCTANEYGGTSFAAPMWAGYLALNQPAGRPTATDRWALSTQPCTRSARIEL
jgi:hypothetical protein